MEQLLNAVMALWFLLVGLFCINKTGRIQAWLKRFYENVPAARPWGGFFNWSQTRGFARFVKVLGALAMVNFFMLVYVIMYGTQGEAL